MKRSLQITLFSLLCLLTLPVRASIRDSINDREIGKKNEIGIEFLGNSYLSPFYGFLDSRYGISPFSIYYSHSLHYRNSQWKFSLGVGVFRSYIVNTQVRPHTYDKPLVTSIPIGFLWRQHYKRNGFWTGVFFLPAFGQQQYIVQGDGQYYHDLNFDFQIVPDSCYQFQSKSKAFVCKIAWNPKISSGVLSERGNNYEWKIFPLWFGVSIGGAW